MYGASIGKLRVYNNGKVLKSMAGNQGNSWKKVDMTISGDYDVSVNGTHYLVCRKTYFFIKNENYEELVAIFKA